VPEDQAEQQAQEAPAAGGGFLGGSRGWIILIAVEVATVVFFLVLMHYRQGAELKDEDKEQLTQIKMAEFNKYALQMRDLNYSIRLATGQTATLAMELRLVLGLLPEARTKQNFEIKEEDWLKFKTALESLETYFRDKLQQYVSQQTHAQLTSPAGQEKIKVFVKEYANAELAKLDLGLSRKDISNERVTDVLIIQYYIQ